VGSCAVRLETLYRVRFSYSGDWGTDLPGSHSTEGRFVLAEGRCEAAPPG